MLSAMDEFSATTLKLSTKDKLRNSFNITASNEKKNMKGKKIMNAEKKTQAKNINAKKKSFQQIRNGMGFT